jgi:small subunit ribosomal protein S3Ae
MATLLTEKIPMLSLDEFVKEVTMGKMSSDMMDVAKKIALIRHVGVKKTKLISSPLKINGDKIDSEDPITEANSEDPITEANSEVSTEANSEVSTEEKVVNVPKEELNKEEDI